MNIILIETEPTEKYPPEISVINALSDIEDVRLYVCSLQPSQYLHSLSKQLGFSILNVKGKILAGKNYGKQGIAKKLFWIRKNRELLWKAIKSVYQEGDLIWVHTLGTLRLLGPELLDKRYVVHLMELVRESRYYYKLPYPRYDLKKYFQSAYKVVECEYNRAHITKAWFDLAELPVILPNKLYLSKDVELDGYKNSKVEEQLKNLEGKKIILFQGGLGPERPIDKFIEAVGNLGHEYAMVVMTGNEYTYNVHPDNLVLIDFIPAPYHLMVTKQAYIGLLCYQPSSSGYSQNDALNSIYCAPNKIFEYSKFGLPMIGNDIPGLRETISYNQFGVCVEHMEVKDITKAILQVEENYKDYSYNSTKYYNSVNIPEIVKEIIK